MNTLVYLMNEKEKEKYNRQLEECAAIIRNGGLVAFPTETVYGLGGDALNVLSSKKIYAAKGRPSDNPLIVHISDMSELFPLVKEVPDLALILAKKYWPGPLTMIFKKSERVPYETTGGLDTVAVRMPSHKLARDFIKAAGVPIAAPSANLSGRPSPTNAGHVYEDLSGKIEAIIDGGRVDIGLESTIIDVSSGEIMLLRPGFITVEMIESIAGKVKRDPALDHAMNPDVKPKAPGMKYRHYAPKGDMAIVEGENEEVIALINELVKKHNPLETAVITTRENVDSYTACKTYCIGSREEDETIARELYAVLRKMDEDGIKHIYVESFEKGRLGDAIMNRLIKAAGHRVIHTESAGHQSQKRG